VMRSGVVQQVGRPWEIYKNPDNQFVASFVGSTNLLDGEVADTGDGRAEVRVGPHRIPMPHRPPGVSRVQVAFRPEDLRLSAGRAVPAADELCLGGRIHSFTFTGSLASYLVDCGDSVLITVQRHRPILSDILPQGAEVTVHLPRAAVYLFHPESGVRL